MSSLPTQVIRKCRRCSQELAAGALACGQCRALVHADELDQLAAAAKAFEELEDWQRARGTWDKALQLLPPDATQAEWVRAQLRRVEGPASAPPDDGQRRWLARLGPLAPLLLLLSKSKALLSIFKLNFLISLVAFIGVYWQLYGMVFGLGFAAQIFIHEMGHFIDIKRRGLPADMPVFLPGLGAYVRWMALGVSLETRAAVSLAGPLAGLLAATGCGLVWWKTGDPIWAALAHTGAWLNVLNLIPVWALDGGQAAAALDKSERWILLTACLVLWLLLGQSMFFLVAGGTVYRLFTKDLPAQPSRAITAYFVAVLAALGILMSLLPTPATGRTP